MGEWKTIGTVSKMQIALSKMRRDPIYDPDPLREVSRIRLGADGVLGHDGTAWMLDSHHHMYPDRRPVPHHRVLLIGFEANYRFVSDKYRPIPMGVAGENLIITSDRVITAEDVDEGVRISGENDSVVLREVLPAEACVPFTRWLMDQPDLHAQDVAGPRHELSQGLRGFFIPYDRPEHYDAQVGDEVAIRT